MSTSVDHFKAGRFYFSPQGDYAGKLGAVIERPIVNVNQRIWLLRLEFEIFLIADENQPPRLHPTGGVASQDVVVTSDVVADKGVMKFAEALGVQSPQNHKSWYRLNKSAQAKAPNNQRWIRVRFGDPDADTDFRQTFSSVEKYESPQPDQIDTSSTAATVRSAFLSANKVRCLLRKRDGANPSEDTLNEFVDEQARHYGEKLVTRTKGGHRRINWYLCWHLWEAAT